MKEIIIHLTMTYYAEIISITPGTWYRKRSTIMMLVTSMNREELRMKMMSRVMITMMITMLTLGSRKSNNLAMILLKKKQIRHIASEHQMTMVTIDFTDQQVNENNQNEWISVSLLWIWFAGPWWVLYLRYHSSFLKMCYSCLCQS